MSNPTGTVANALALAERGFGIFPVWSARDGVCRCPKAEDCPSPAKHPITADGFKSATTDPQSIKTFLSAASQPNYGVVPPDGIFILDVDGPDVERFTRLSDDYGPLPDTFIVKTAHGAHVYHEWPAGVPRPDHKMFGLVTRWGNGSMGGYVLGPGSVHASGFVYEIASPMPPSVFPPRWVEGASVRPVTFTIPGGDDDLPGPGGRHDWLRDRARFHAGHIRDRGVLEATMLAENARLSEPKTPEEVRQAIGDVLEKFGPDPEAAFALNYSNGSVRDIISGKNVELWMPEVLEKRGEAVGELTIVVDGITVQKSTEPLSNAVKADRLAAAMERLVPGIHWPSVLTSFYLRRLEDYNRREPLAHIGTVAPLSMEPEYVIGPLCIKNTTTILFAKEGTGKSTVAAAAGLSVASGVPIFDGWVVPQARPVLVLDWEASEEDWNRTVWSLAQGVGIDAPDTLHYQRMVQAITKDIPNIVRLVTKHDHGLVIVDSAMMASPPGNGGAEDSALALFHALRSMNTTVLLIDHLNKQTASGSGSRPYGSVYKPALARATFELHDREAPTHYDDGGLGTQHLALSQRKANLAALQDPAFLRIVRIGTQTRIESDMALYTRDLQYRNVVRAVKAAEGTVADIAARASTNKETVEGILKSFPEFVYAGGVWAYVAEVSDDEAR